MYIAPLTADYIGQ